jgi:hypothetical protein
MGTNMSRAMTVKGLRVGGKGRWHELILAADIGGRASLADNPVGHSPDAYQAPDEAGHS